MRGLILRRPGSLNDMKLEELPDPEVFPGQVLVALEVAGLNPMDYKLGLTGHPAWKYPHIAGLDGVGVVQACGEGVDQNLLGARVAFHTDPRMDGCFAGFVSVAAHTVAIVPAGVSNTDAACLPCAGLTALQALADKAHIQPGDTVLIQGGAGGVGGFAIQLAHRMGARVITTCSPHNTDYVRSLGADEVIDYNRESLAERIHDLTDGRGVELVIDPTGNKSATIGLSLLAFSGHLVCLSGLPELDRYNQSAMAPSIHDMALGNVHAFGTIAAQTKLAQDLEKLLGLLATGELKSTHSKTVSIETVPAALEELRERHVQGKIVAYVSGLQ